MDERNPKGFSTESDVSIALQDCIINGNGLHGETFRV